MKHTIRFIILLFSLVMTGVSDVWADITENDIIINVLPNKAAGTVSVTNISGMTVTITATPATGYTIDAAHILVEKMVDPMAASRRAPGMAPSLPVDGNNPFTFTIPDGYTGAYVTVNFYKKAEGFIQITSLSEITDMDGKYQLTADVSGISSSLGEFTGTLDGGLHKIIGSSAPLFASTDGAIIRNIIFEDVNISSGDTYGDAGAVTSKAKGATRIYNCGILPTSVERDNKGNITGFYGSSVGGSRNVGGLVGLLDGTARVINCFSYATITGGSTVAGIVGNIGYDANTSITQDNVNTKPMVVNCMFYGDITGGTSISPVYGGAKGAMIKNETTKTVNNNAVGIGVNPYCYFRKKSSFNNTTNFGNIDAFKRSWPAEEKNLTRFEYYRSILNSNRKLCTWWVNGTSDTAPTDEDVANVGIAKWVLDPSIAPYPILKEWGKYPSVINLDPDKVWDPRTEIKEGDAVTSVTPHWVQRSDAKEWEGKSYGTLAVTIKAGAHGSGSTSRNIPITDMDTLNCDYSYYKIQLPYYNEVFGNPNGATHEAKYGGNYTEYVVTGWEIEAAGSTTATDYNFADRNSINGRVFAQGGYYYVPKDVTSITITARWGKAFYLSNRGYSIDRVNVTKADYKKDNAFAPAGTISNNFQGHTVYNDLQEAIKALGTNVESPTVYDQAIVLIGNHQVKNGINDVGYNLDSKWHPFTIMSADLDFDNEPDNCLEFQFRTQVQRPGIQPIRFDFLPVVELGLALRHDNLAYAIGIFVPQGHFEVTETAFMRTTQFEYDGFQSYTDKRIEDKSPVIINGGEYEMFTVRYHASNRTSYFLLGGNAWIHRFAPGAHPNTGQKPSIYLCPVNVIGGEVKELYLTGLYRPELAVPNNQGAPRCYTDGGKFDIMAGAGYDKVEAGSNVTFKINHSKITEFYGGGINGSNPISGNIDVTIDNSYVDKYCGGPKVGDMTGKTVTTHATGTTFGVFFGGGNGGNSYYRQLQKDGDLASTHIGTWTDQGYNWNGFKPLEVKDDGTDNKGYHAEYEFEVFNHSNGVTDQITQRGFIKWIQFGITKTGDVSSTLSDCKILGNFYGGGNLATVDGNVTSTLTNTQVAGSAFGAGYSAAIPTFQVHDKSKATFPSITAGVITDGHIGYGDKVYEWTNEKLEGKDEAYMKAYPTYEKDGKWYCYTWNSLDDLGAVTGNVTLTIDGNTTLTDGKVMKVAHSVYGGGEESGVEGNTEVSVTGGTIGTPNLGGAEYGNVFGGGKGKEKNATAGLVKGNATVSISGSPTIIHNVYGGGAYGSVGTFTYADDDYHTAHPEVPVGMPTALHTENTGVCNVTITGGTIGTNGKENGMIFGSSRGDVATPEGEPAVDPNDRMAWVYSTQVNIGTENATTGPTIKGSIYGSGENGHTLQNTVLNINSGTVGIPTGEKITDDNGTPDNKDDDIEYSGANYPYRGNVYGGGCGTDTYNDGTVDKYNPLAGIVKGTTTIYIKGGHVVRNVYGAGAMGSVGGGTTTDAGKTTINVTGGRIGYDGNSNNDGCIFGAARGENGISTATSNLANVRETEVNINAHPTDATKSPVIWGSVFGGGEAGTVKEGVAVNMTGGLIHKDIYGGGALADTQTSNWDATGGTWADAQKSALHTTTVRATGGRVVEEIFGGGLGEDGKPAYVWGDVLLDLNGTTPIDETTHKPSTTGMATTSTTGCVVGQIFGCNNVNGTPKGDVMVHIYATQNAEADKIANTPATGTEGEEGYKPADETQKVKGRYDITAVYGGGNMAAYEPADPDNNKSEVIIDGCQLTSIKTVYGGGNAACTPSTNVTVNGTFEVEELFGGGNGLDDIDVNGVTKPNPGANVGYKNYTVYEKVGDEWIAKDDPAYDTKEERTAPSSAITYGTGQASVNIFGGTVHRVFGGSNTKGNVRQTAVTLLDENSGCDFCVDEAYGGGKSAEMDAEAKLLMACIPGLEAVYGGAEAADVRGNVTLNITNGTFDRVFGGNNLSGTISGSITVNVEEIGCKPVKIGELYGGGNEAGYSVYGYDSNGKPVESGTTPLYNDPQVNVMSFTSIGNIYGGGYGSGATMVGNPTVNINVAYGRYYNDDESVVGENAKTPNNYPIPSHATGKIGAISNVFGGGNAAKVIGNTTVNVGTLSEVYVVKQVTVGDDVSSLYIRNNNGTYSKASGTAQDGTTYYEEQDVIGADIRGNVYGGGNNAEVTGDTHVVIGEKYVAP